MLHAMHATWLLQCVCTKHHCRCSCPPHLCCALTPPALCVLSSAVELVELLKPSFVTLEEVPGFLVQR